MTTSPKIDDKLVHIREEVRAAFKNGVPVVALESTIISHGMPYPTNVSTANAMEDVVRKKGCVPATIGVIGGRITIGLSKDEIELLGRGEVAVFKAAAKDLGLVMATHAHAGTTVSATMVCANFVGIRVFATGGIGGVHREVNATFDISADLTELARTPVVVVSAGCKSILDVPKTVEYLETLGVPIVGFGTSEFPAFYSRQSGISLNFFTSKLSEIAESYVYDRKLGRTAGLLVANPIPIRNEIPFAEVNRWIDEAMISLRDEQIVGKSVTPFLLDELNKRSEGRSVASNIALVRNNVSVAADLALELQNIQAALGGHAR